MTKIIKPLVIVMAALVLTACPDPDKKKNAPINQFRGGPAGQIPPVNSNPGHHVGQNGALTFTSSTGEITQHPQQADFQESAYNMVSALGNPLELLGLVSGHSGQRTGIRFGAQVNTTSGQPQNGNIVIQFWDTWAADGDVSPGQIVATYVSGNVNFTSQVQGSANLVFKDHTHGITINMQGNFIHQGSPTDMFTGTISFQNERYWDSEVGPGASDILGQFQVKTCGFFTCN